MGKKLIKTEGLKQKQNINKIYEVFIYLLENLN